MGARENECQISQNYILHNECSEFYLCFHNSCEIWHSFSRIPIKNFLWYYYRWPITSLALEKCKKKNAIFFKLFWYKVFAHWKLKLLNFLMDSVLKCYTGFVRRIMTLYSKECNTPKISSNGKSLCLTNIVLLQQKFA